MTLITKWAVTTNLAVGPWPRNAETRVSICGEPSVSKTGFPPLLKEIIISLLAIIPIIPLLIHRSLTPYSISNRKCHQVTHKKKLSARNSSTCYIHVLS